MGNSVGCCKNKIHNGETRNVESSLRYSSPAKEGRISGTSYPNSSLTSEYGDEDGNSFGSPDVNSSDNQFSPIPNGRRITTSKGPQSISSSKRPIDDNDDGIDTEEEFVCKQGEEGSIEGFILLGGQPEDVRDVDDDIVPRPNYDPADRENFPPVPEPRKVKT